MFTVAELKDFMPSDHPLRAIRGVVNEALTLNGMVDLIYAGVALRSRRRSYCEPCSWRFFLDAQRAPVGRADPLQPAVPLVIGLTIDDEVWDHSSA